MSGIPNLGEGFIRSHELLEELFKDINLAYQMLENDKQSQYLRRCVVRANFSFIEAMIEVIKVELRSTIRTVKYELKLTEKDKEVLGSTFIFNSKQDKFLSLEINIKKTFKLATKIWEIKKFQLVTDTQDFQDFLAAKSARNKLTHPKSYYDIEVTDIDMHYYTPALFWLKTEFSRLFKARIDSLESNIVAQN